MSLNRIATILGIIGLISGGVWWAAMETARANDQEEEQGTMAQAVQKLTAIHVRQATVAQAEQDQLARLCAEGKLEVVDCPPVVLRPLPSVSAGPSP